MVRRPIWAGLAELNGELVSARSAVERWLHRDGGCGGRPHLQGYGKRHRTDDVRVSRSSLRDVFGQLRRALGRAPPRDETPALVTLRRVTSSFLLGDRTMSAAKKKCAPPSCGYRAVKDSDYYSKICRGQGKTADILCGGSYPGYSALAKN